MEMQARRYGNGVSIGFMCAVNKVDREGNEEFMCRLL